MTDPTPPREPADGAETPRTRLRPLVIKVSIFLLIAVGGILAYRFTDLRDWFQPAGRAADWVRGHGAWGAVVFTAAMSALILVGVPRLLFCPIAGALYGFWVGLGLCIVGTGSSYYLAFAFIRGRSEASGRPKVLHPRLAFLARDPGFIGVMAARMIPVPGMVATLGLSLSGVSHRNYMIGSVIGLIPEAAPLVLLGAGILHADWLSFLKLAVPVIICVVLMQLALRHLARRYRERHE